MGGLGPIGLAACGGSGGDRSRPHYPYEVIATTGMVTDIVRQVAGQKASVRGLIASGVDPHLYKPTRNDVAALQQAAIVFHNGLMLEGKLSVVLGRLGHSGKPVYPVTALLNPTDLLSAPGQIGHADPHVWMDVMAWSRAVEAVAGRLAEFDPPNAEYYRANAERYQEELRKLHQYVREVISSIPERQRILITAHDAFGYFGRAYGIRVEGIQGLSTESEAGLQDINRLVDLIVENRVRAVFVETSLADRNVRALIEGAAARGQPVKIGGSLYSDAMGPTGSYEGTYIGMMDHNATVIARALGGHTPEGGLHGKLNLPE